MKLKLSKIITLLLCVVIITGIFPGYTQASGNPAGGPVVTAGDINGDGGEPNNLDLVTLFQHLSGWQVDVVVEALDVNGDGDENNLDLVTLFQYLSGWQVEIFPQIICDHDGGTEIRDASPATCTGAGYTGDTYCLICNRKISSGETIPTLPHEGGMPTCNTKAICNTCGNPYGDFDPSNHSGGTEIIGDYLPGCVTDGYTGDTYCLGCGEKISDGRIIPAIGYHGDTETRNANAVTCTEDGYTGDTYCTVCGELLYSGTVIPATGHLNVEARGSFPPTCTEDGFSGDVYCTDCGSFLYAGSVLPATGHTGGAATYYSQAVCDICGEKYGSFADISAYEQLTENQKGIYREIDTAVSNFEMNWFEVPFVPGTTKASIESDVRVALHAVAYDKPEYFWMPKTYSYQTTTDEYTEELLAFELSFSFDAKDPERGYFNVTPAERAQMQAELDVEIRKVLDALESFETDFEKEWYLHDYLCEHISYDYDSANTVNSGGNADFTTYTIYGALVKGTCVCEGYSRAMQYFCHRLGIPCGLITGTGQGGPHMWNIINPGDGLYYIDVTFDDSIENSGLSLPGVHNYFNVTRQQLELDHTIDDLYIDGLDYSDPNSDFNFYNDHGDSTEYYFYKKSGAYVYKNDASGAAQYAISQFNKGYTMIDIEYEDGMTKDEILSTLAKELLGKLRIMGSAMLPFGNYMIVVLQQPKQ